MAKEHREREDQETPAEDDTVREQFGDYFPDDPAIYADFFENANVPMHWVGSDGTVLRANDAELDALGYSREEYVGHHIANFHADQEVIDDILERLSAGEVLEEYEARMVCKDGSIRHVLIDSSVHWQDGEFINTRCVTRDITERKQHERELERRARQQQVVAELGEFALETSDLDELMDRAARQVADVLDNEYCKVLDLDPDAEELLLRQGVGWRDGIVGEATVSSIEADSQAAYTLANNHPIVVEDLETETRFSGPELLTSHGVRSGLSTIIGPFDEPWGILGTHDTERRTYTEEDVSFVQSIANVLAEAIERQQYQRELEQLVADLEESNERLEQFAHVVSHDLQEPLRMVSNYLQLIERRHGDTLDEDTAEFLTFAVDGAERMQAMIDGLLEYSRVQTEGEALEETDLEAVFEDALADLQLRIEETDAEIVRDELPVVEGDPEQLRQVFQNLLKNSIAYSGDEPPQITVTAERRGREWLISVEDEGIGIDPDDQERVFEMFKRLHTREEHSSTGIGLALCKRIVERHGGDIWIDSEPGDGTNFSFTLPDA